MRAQLILYQPTARRNIIRFEPGCSLCDYTCAFRLGFCARWTRYRYLGAQRTSSEFQICVRDGRARTEPRLRFVRCEFELRKKKTNEHRCRFRQTVSFVVLPSVVRTFLRFRIASIKYYVHGKKKKTSHQRRSITSDTGRNLHDDDERIGPEWK